MHFCGLAKARSFSVVHNHYSNLCRIAGGLSEHQTLARLSTALKSGHALRPIHLLSIGGAAVVAESTLPKVRSTLTVLSGLKVKINSIDLKTLTFMCIEPSPRGVASRYHLLISMCLKDFTLLLTG